MADGEEVAPVVAAEAVSREVWQVGAGTEAVETAREQSPMHTTWEMG